MQPVADIPLTTTLRGRRLILASTSPYRRELLERLRIRFDVMSPGTDETAALGEAPGALAVRLAIAKAMAISSKLPDAVVIGSDQVVELDGMTLGKPGNHARAAEQLARMSGREVVFHTAVAVQCAQTEFNAFDCAVVKVRFRDLKVAAIESYLRAETPYDCAGSAKSEGLGISLLESIFSDDPTALVGLPLIRTCTLLRNAGMSIA